MHWASRQHPTLKSPGSPLACYCRTFITTRCSNCFADQHCAEAPPCKQQERPRIACMEDFPYTHPSLHTQHTRGSVTRRLAHRGRPDPSYTQQSLSGAAAPGAQRLPRPLSCQRQRSSRTLARRRGVHAEHRPGCSAPRLELPAGGQRRLRRRRRRRPRDAQAAGVVRRAARALEPQDMERHARGLRGRCLG